MSTIGREIRGVLPDASGLKTQSFRIPDGGIIKVQSRDDFQTIITVEARSIKVVFERGSVTQLDGILGANQHAKLQAVFNEIIGYISAENACDESGSFDWGRLHLANLLQSYREMDTRLAQCIAICDRMLARSDGHSDIRRHPGNGVGLVEGEVNQGKTKNDILLLNDWPGTLTQSRRAGAASRKGWGVGLP